MLPAARAQVTQPAQLAPLPYAGLGGATPILIDHHYYLNWQLPVGQSSAQPTAMGPQPAS